MRFNGDTVSAEAVILRDMRDMLDSAVAAGDSLLINHGFLCALRDPSVVEMACRYGDPVDLLEGFLP